MKCSEPPKDKSKSSKKEEKAKSNKSANITTESNSDGVWDCCSIVLGAYKAEFDNTGLSYSPVYSSSDKTSIKSLKNVSYNWDPVNNPAKA